MEVEKKIPSKSGSYFDSKELDTHFQDVMCVLQEQFKLDQYDTIIWTGGIVDLHKNELKNAR